MSRDRGLIAGTLCVYAAASLLHYAHNAELLQAYPNMPQWLTRAQVYTAWLAVTSVGIAGFLLLRSRKLAGLVVLALYAILGFDGLSHYALAPLSHHTPTMNATIWLECGTATLLLAALVNVSRGILRGSDIPSAP